MGKWDEGTDHTTQVEDHPEGGNVFALVLLRRIRHHDGTLSSPQHSGAKTEQGSRKDDKAAVAVMVVREDGDNVEAVAKAAKA